MRLNGKKLFFSTLSSYVIVSNNQEHYVLKHLFPTCLGVRRERAGKNGKEGESLTLFWAGSLEGRGEYLLVVFSLF